MKCSVEVRCIVCQLIFCCNKCRWNHERTSHGLSYDCRICRGSSYLCKPEDLNTNFIRHLTDEHLPLQCRKCNQTFNTMEDLVTINKCVSISELIKDSNEMENSREINKKFDSLLEKVEKDGENYEAIISVNKSSKTAIITPVMRKKYLVDYESSSSEEENMKDDVPIPNTTLPPKTPKLKRHRASTPHVKKFLRLMRQKTIEEDYEGTDESNSEGRPRSNDTTPSRVDSEPIPDAQKEMTTPTSHLPHIAKLALAVTTSTPTHPVAGGWALFPEQGADSPLSEIENSESPAQSIVNEASKSESGNVAPKLKSIIVTGSRIRLGSQDSLEKQATVQDSTNCESSNKTKRVKFADDTVFEQEHKVKRVYRKPKRMLTPGPQRPKFHCNPRFQALINRFENQAITIARTPVNRDNRDTQTEGTPAVGEPSNIPARAINFKEESPIVEKENYSKESNELFKTCVESPVGIGVNNAITAFTANMAGSLQSCLTTALSANDEGTEIQFKFVITKKKISVKKVADQIDTENDNTMDEGDSKNKENIWSTVTKAVKQVIWGEPEQCVTTPFRSLSSNDTTSSSASKRKCKEMSDNEISPLNHKRYKYEGRIQGRPPIRRSKTWVSSLRSTHSAEQHTILSKLSDHEEFMNQSF